MEYGRHLVEVDRTGERFMNITWQEVTEGTPERHAAWQGDKRVACVEFDKRPYTPDDAYWIMRRCAINCSNQY